MKNNKTHAKQLLALLSDKDENPCNCCPRWDLGYINYNYCPIACQYCRTYVGLSPISTQLWGIADKCPCHVLGPDECIKRTWIRLEADGFLD